MGAHKDLLNLSSVDLLSQTLLGELIHELIQALRDSTNVAYRKQYTNIAITISQQNI